MRLIRLIRIIKLYKYIIVSMSKKEDVEPEFDENEDESQQSLFQRETDPSKLGKALSDQNTREVIIGVLLMLMMLPLLSPSEIDYSKSYGLRQLFWFGASVCNVIPPQTLIAPKGNDPRMFITPPMDVFLCNMPDYMT